MNLMQEKMANIEAAMAGQGTEERDLLTVMSEPGINRFQLVANKYGEYSEGE